MWSLFCSINNQLGTRWIGRLVSLFLEHPAFFCLDKIAVSAQTLLDWWKLGGSSGGNDWEMISGGGTEIQVWAWAASTFYFLYFLPNILHEQLFQLQSVHFNLPFQSAVNKIALSLSCILDTGGACAFLQNHQSGRI